jgi:hypothetical protein
MRKEEIGFYFVQFDVRIFLSCAISDTAHRNNGKVLDLSMSYRLSGLAKGAKLEVKRKMGGSTTGTSADS